MLVGILPISSTSSLCKQVSFWGVSISLCCGGKGIFKAEPSFSDPNSNEWRDGQ